MFNNKIIVLFVLLYVFNKIYCLSIVINLSSTCTSNSPCTTFEQLGKELRQLSSGGNVIVDISSTLASDQIEKVNQSSSIGVINNCNIVFNFGENLVIDGSLLSSNFIVYDGTQFCLNGKVLIINGFIGTNFENYYFIKSSLYILYGIQKFTLTLDNSQLSNSNYILDVSGEFISTVNIYTSSFINFKNNNSLINNSIFNFQNSSVIMNNIKIINSDFSNNKNYNIRPIFNINNLKIQDQTVFSFENVLIDNIQINSSIIQYQSATFYNSIQNINITNSKLANFINSNSGSSRYNQNIFRNVFFKNNTFINNSTSNNSVRDGNNSLIKYNVNDSNKNVDIYIQVNFENNIMDNNSVVYYFKNINTNISIDLIDFKYVSYYLYNSSVNIQPKSLGDFKLVGYKSNLTDLRNGENGECNCCIGCQVSNIFPKIICNNSLCEDYISSSSSQSSSYNNINSSSGNQSSEGSQQRSENRNKKSVPLFVKFLIPLSIVVVGSITSLVVIKKKKLLKQKENDISINEVGVNEVIEVRGQPFDEIIIEEDVAQFD